MYSNYLASAEDADSEATGTASTGQFWTSDLLESAQKYKSKMGKTQTSLSAVRLGGAARSSLGNAGPRRITPSKDWAPTRMTSNAEDCRKRLQTIEDEEMASSNTKAEDRSVSSLLGSLRMSPKNASSSLRMSPSPDSGSFSMGTADLASSKYSGGNYGTDFTDSLPSSKNESRGAVRMASKPRPSAPLPVRMVKEERENMLPVRITAKSREEVLAPIRMTKEEREERAPVRMTKEEKEERAPTRMSREEKENHAPHLHPMRTGENGWGAGKQHREGFLPKSNIESSWDRKQSQLQVQMQNNRRRSREFEEQSQRSEVSLKSQDTQSSNEIRLKCEDRIMSEDLARVKLEQEHKRDENRALGLRERLQHLSGGVGEAPASLTKTTSCPPVASAAPPSILPQRLHQSKSNPHQKLGTQQPQPQSLPRADDPRNPLAASGPPTARSLLQTPLPSKPGAAFSSRTPAPASYHSIATPTPAMPSTPREPTMPPPSMAISQQAKEQLLMIRGKRYRVMKLLGKGGSSRVYEAFDELRNQVVAIKRVNLEEADEETTRGYINEIGMLEKLQGEDRIVRLFDHETVEDENVLYVIMEKGDTDLASLLKKYASKEEITPAMIKHYWTEMLQAVSVIHKAGIIHKDLKPANFLLVAGRLKLIDFGIASAVMSDKTSVMIDNQMGTFNFMSPESIQDLNPPQSGKPSIKISFKSDVWSLGCILYNLTYGKMPFGDIKHPLMKLQAITDHKHQIPFPPLEKEDQVLTSLIQSCLVRDPAIRPSIVQLLQHQYVTGAEAPLPKEKPKGQNASNPLDQLRMLGELGVLSPSTLARASAKVRASNSDLVKE